MAKNFQQVGDVIDFANNTGSPIASGDVVEMKHSIGVALVDIPDTETGSVAVEGVFSGVPKVSGAVFVQGEKLIWDTSAGAFDDSSATPATGDITGAAVAWTDGANGDTTCTVKLTPGNAAIA